MIKIAILTNCKNNKLSKLIKNFIEKKGKNAYEVETISKGFYKDIKEDEIDYLIFEISREDILNISFDNLEFDIIVESFLEEETSDVIEKIQLLLSRVKKNGYFIFNSDLINHINFMCKDLYPITYGLNGKTSVTASSINDFQSLEFSYCLQRAIIDIKGNIIEPFEGPITVEGESQDIYYFLAGYTCLILLGYKF